MRRLSKHFTLAEAFHSDYALRHGIDNTTEDPHILANLGLVAHEGLEPIRAHYKIAYSPNSFYRCLELNTALNGSPNSQHMRGEGADIKLPGIACVDLAYWIQSNINFDKLILECYTLNDPNSGWVHYSITAGVPRREVKTYTGGKYLDGLVIR